MEHGYIRKSLVVTINLFALFQSQTYILSPLAFDMSNLDVEIISFILTLCPLPRDFIMLKPTK